MPDDNRRRVLCGGRAACPAYEGIETKLMAPESSPGQRRSSRGLPRL